jgi:toxin ParE1/3/4
MRVRYLAAATRDLDDIFAHIAERNPNVADRVILELRTWVEVLSDFPKAGRETAFVGVRSTPVPRLPYVIYYRVRPGELRILRVRHARRRPLSRA